MGQSSTSGTFRQKVAGLDPLRRLRSRERLYLLPHLGRRRIPQSRYIARQYPESHPLPRGERRTRPAAVHHAGCRDRATWLPAHEQRQVPGTLQRRPGRRQAAAGRYRPADERQPCAAGQAPQSQAADRQQACRSQRNDRASPDPRLRRGPRGRGFRPGQGRHGCDPRADRGHGSGRSRLARRAGGRNE